MATLFFFGKGGPFLIGPTNERWDAAMLIRQNSVEDFLASTQLLAEIIYRSSGLTVDKFAEKYLLKSLKQKAMVDNPFFSVNRLT